MQTERRESGRGGHDQEQRELGLGILGKQKPLQFFPSLRNSLPITTCKENLRILSAERATFFASCDIISTLTQIHPALDLLNRQVDQGEKDFNRVHLSRRTQDHSPPPLALISRNSSPFLVQRNSARLPSLSTTHNATFAHRPNHRYQLLHKR